MKPISRRKRGVALIIVLSILSILVTLVLAFFSMVQTEREASSSFSESIEVRNLSEVPVNLVTTQLRKATENNAPSGNEIQFKTWASQPGLIRVFGTELDDTAVRGKTTALYKLYSDDKMVVTRAGSTSIQNGMNPGEAAVELQNDLSDLGAWNSRPGMFIDLNEPVPVPGSTPSYKFPIVDPRASYEGGGYLPVDGFHYQTSGVAGAVLPGSRGDINARLPMPVRWIYLLRDGTLITPSSGDETTTQFDASGSITGEAPTSENPIVGRIAFWTDDDSSKVNINTASEGSHWDVPVATTQTEKDYAVKMPAQNEFSRYPGHPAATSLSPVFQAFSQDFYVNPADPAVTSVHELLHKLSPRTPWGGSMAGTQNISSANAGLPLKQDRLYASVEEMFLDPERLVNLPQLNAASLELGKFFLTAHSRSPELNLFGKPRMSLWPQSSDKNQRNPKDKLLAFMSETTGSNDRPWYFKRTKNFSASDSGSSQSSTADYEPGISRLFTHYYRYLMGQDEYLIPGFGGRTFTEKYGENQRNQLGCEIFDLIRWGVNSYSTVSQSGWPTYTYLPDRVSGNKGQSSAVPLRFGNYGRGFGRWPTITEAVIVFVRIGEKTEAPDKTEGKLQAYLILEPFIPVAGPASMTPNIIYQIQGMQNFKVTMQGQQQVTQFFKSKMENLCNVTEGTFGYLACGSTPFSGLGNMLAAGSKAAKNPVAADPGNDVSVYPFVSKTIDIPAGATYFDFSGGEFAIRTYPGWSSPAPTNNDAVQTVRMIFPPVRLMLPKTPEYGGVKYTTLAQRFAPGTAPKYNERLVMAGDIVRSIEVDVNAPPKGDLRFYSAMRTVPTHWFKVADDYGVAGVVSPVERRQFLRLDDTASNGQFGPHAGALPDGQNWGEQSQRQSNHNTAGTLVRNFMYARGCPPSVTRGLNGAMLNVGNNDAPANDRPGDWDNGVGIIADGPYIRKPDEGNASFSGGTVEATKSTYFSRHHFDKETGTSYSPNRQIASAVAFGSLPTGMDTTPSLAVMPSASQLSDLGLDPNNKQRPWQTLLFCPNPASRSTAALEEPDKDDHPGFDLPRDHLLLDFFWMPITEPYAISEPLSTAGKVNMNYQMAPFSYIERSTGVRAVLKSARVTAISPSSAGGPGTGVETSSSASSSPYNKSGSRVYKQSDAGSTHSSELRYAINADVTLEGFRNRFDRGDIFRSASEICEIFLVPKRLNGKSYAADAASPPTNYADMTEWWNGSSNLDILDAFELTGDNSREMPYNHIYPRLTTRSNTFTIHYRVQTLKKARSTDPDEWVEDKDTVASEYRGSTTLERYLDPNEAELGAVGVGSSTFNDSWDGFYRIRIIQRKQFVP